MKKNLLIFVGLLVGLPVIGQINVTNVNTAAGTSTAYVLGQTNATGNLRRLTGMATTNYVNAATNAANTVMTNRAAVLRLNTVTKTANYTITTNDFMVRVTNSVADIIITLPPASNCVGQVFAVKKISDDAFGINVTPAGADVIDGSNAVFPITGFASMLRFGAFRDGTVFGWDIQ